MQKSYFVYMLQCFDGTYYVGVTGDFEKRMAQHHAGAFPNCYTFMRRPLKLSWAQEYGSIFDAIDAEKRLKKWKHNAKSALARGDVETIKKLRHGKMAIPRQARDDNSGPASSAG